MSGFKPKSLNNCEDIIVYWTIRLTLKRLDAWWTSINQIDSICVKCLGFTSLSMKLIEYIRYVPRSKLWKWWIEFSDKGSPFVALFTESRNLFFRFFHIRKIFLSKIYYKYDKGWWSRGMTHRWLRWDRGFNSHPAHRVIKWLKNMQCYQM